MGKRQPKRKRKPHRGHRCWSCGRVLPNERFSGRGHARHVCRACQRLGKAELTTRQALRDLERHVGPSGLVRRGRHHLVQAFLAHAEERVRDCARAVLEDDARVRAELRAAYEAEAIDEERYWEEQQARADPDFWAEETLRTALDLEGAPSGWREPAEEAS